MHYGYAVYRRKDEEVIVTLLAASKEEAVRTLGELLPGTRADYVLWEAYSCRCDCGCMKAAGENLYRSLCQDCLCECDLEGPNSYESLDMYDLYKDRDEEGLEENDDDEECMGECGT